MGIKANARKVYDFIIEYILDHDYPPSMSEICEGTGLKSKSTVKYAMDYLFSEGLLETEAQRCGRAYRVKELYGTVREWRR